MHTALTSSLILVLACVPFGLAAAPANSPALGMFEGQADVGGPRRAGSAGFDAAQRAYAISGGGANMWFTNDAFHVVWKKVSGDVTLAADIATVSGNEVMRAPLF